MKTGAELITEERARQIDREGYSAEHDDSREKNRQLARAAESYLTHYTGRAWTFTNEFNLPNITDGPKTYRSGDAPDAWPWDVNDWKPKTPFKDLVRAGALIAAEIDRLQRLEAL